MNQQTEEIKGDRDEQIRGNESVEDPAPSTETTEQEETTEGDQAGE